MLTTTPDGGSRFIIDANYFALTANGGVTYPFTFDGTTLTVPNLVVTGANLQPGAVSAPLRGDVSNYVMGQGQGSFSGPDPNLKQTFTVQSSAFPTLITVSGTFTLAPNTTLAGLQILIDGAFASNVLIAGTSASLASGSTSASNVLFGVALVYLSTGSHQLSLQRSYAGAAAGSKVTIDTLQWAGLNWRA